jgi:hypothetical protein
MRPITRTLLAVAMLAALPLAANAESTTVTTGSANARLDFQVTIPRVLMLQVGSAGTGIDQISFDMSATPANVGNGTPVAGTGGDQGAGAVTAKVLGNNGNVTLVATSLGALTNAAGDTIPYSEINTTATAGTTATVLAAPALANGASSSVALTAVNKIVRQDAKWTFAYKNTNPVAPGVYGGSAAGGNGRVPYTASMP